MKLNDRKSRFTREAPKLDKYDRAVNLAFFVVDCIAVRRFSLEGKYISAAVFAILGLWLLKKRIALRKDDEVMDELNDIDPVWMIQELIKKSGGHRYINYVFEIWYKYSHERNYTVSYELCEFDFDENLTWENDWWEGQQEVMFKRVVALEDILDYYFENHKE